MVNLSANAETVLAKRYYTRDEQGAINEDGEAMFCRVAETLAEVDRQYGADTGAVDATAQKFYGLMSSLDFLPNSPTLANAGARTGQLSACYVLPVPDDIRGIFDTIRDAALIHQTGGGTGFAFSRLRPKGDRVGGNHGVSSGPVSFMDVYNAATESIKQGGQRRGANMGILRIDHPDIMEFIGHKQDLSKLTNFNISVAVTDAFMLAVEAGTDFAMVNPRTGAEVGRLDARELFRDIVARAWSTGEPGIVFIDRMNEYCPVPWMGHYEATNPCFIGSTVIKSPEGDTTIAEMAAAGSEYPVYAFDKSTDRTVVKMARNPRVTGRQVPVMRLTLDNGQTITATPNHKFWVREKSNHSWERGAWVELRDLKPGMVLTPFCSSINTKGHERVSTGAFHEGAHRLYMEFLLGRPLAPGEDVHHRNEDKTDQRAVNLEVLSHVEHQRQHKMGADNPNFADVSTDSLIAKGREVLAMVGPKMTFRDYRKATMGDTGYGVKKVLTSFQTWGNFKTHVVGNCKVVAVEDAGVDDVYNITVDDVHNYFANGVLVKNCGEQPLIPYESCNLGSINLENFVTETWSRPLDPNAFRVTDGPRVDWSRLRTAIHDSVHLLDNVIDANCYPIEETRTVALATRKIGLGVMGFARMMFKLGVPYGGDSSLKLAGELMSFIDYESKIASVSLARQRGVFPARKRHESESNRIYQRWCGDRQSHPDRHPEADYDLLAHLISQYGMRNSTTTTIAPTGTLSIIANTSGGCEPVFGLAFKRWQADTHMLDSDPIFEDSLRRTLPNAADEVLAGVEAAHGSLAEYIASLDPDDRTAGRLVMLAATFRTAHDISPAEHVLIQSAFQAFNDSATSKTINFPEAATVADVEQAYRLAYETGCKGITVYRNNSRQFQPLSVGDTKTAEVLAVVPMAKPAGCPECGGPITRSEGCESCACGWSACSVA